MGQKTRIHATCFALPFLLMGCDTAAEAEATNDKTAAANVAAGAQAEATVQADAELEGTIEPAAIDIEATAKLIESGEIETAEELEIALNDEARGLAKVDVDLDGKVDPIAVVEVRGEADVQSQLEVRAVPSARLDVEHSVVIAVFDFKPIEAEKRVVMRAHYGPAVRVRAKAEAEFVYEASFVATFSHHVVVGAAVPLVTWAFIVERPVYYGVWVHEHHHVKIPPGHLKHGHWKATGHHHAKAGAHAHADGHASAKHHGGVKVKHHGGGGAKVKAKSSHDGGAKGKVSVKLGGGAKSGVKVGGKAKAKIK
jgi:hypothetical protein